MHIPLEIAFEIVSYMDSPEDIKNLSLCSRQLRAGCVPSMFKHLTFGTLNVQTIEKALALFSTYTKNSGEYDKIKNQPYSEKTEGIRYQLGGLKYLLSFIDTVSVTGASQTLISLQSGVGSAECQKEVQDLIDVAYFLRDAPLATMFGDQPVGVACSERIGRWAEVLLQQKPKATDILNSPDRNAAMNTLQNLESLALHLIASCMHHLPRVEELHLNNVINAVPVLSPNATHKSLRRLYMRDCLIQLPEMGISGVQTLTQSFATLRFVDIRQAHLQTAGGLSKAIAHLPNCETLSFGLPARCQDGLQLPENWSLPSLKSFTIVCRVREFENITWPSTIDAPSLSKFQANINVLRHLALPFSNLATLQIDGVAQVDELASIYKRCSNLEITSCAVDLAIGADEIGILGMLIQSMPLSIKQLKCIPKRDSFGARGWSQRTSLRRFNSFKCLPQLRSLDISVFYGMSEINDNDPRVIWHEARKLKGKAFPKLREYCGISLKRRL